MSDKNERPEFYEALGRALKTERAARGLSRQELADLAGISYPYLSEIENGSKRASSKALFMLAAALGMAPSELMGSAERMPSRDRDSRSNRAQITADRMMMSAQEQPWAYAESPSRPAEPPADPGGDRGDRGEQVGEIVRALHAMSDDDVELVARLVRKLSR